MSSPLSLLLQKVCEVVALVHVVCVFAFLRVQLLDGVTVALFRHQQLSQHPPVRLAVLLLQALQLSKRHSIDTEVRQASRRRTVEHLAEAN